MLRYSVLCSNLVCLLLPYDNVERHIFHILKAGINYLTFGRAMGDRSHVEGSFIIIPMFDSQ